MNKFIVLILPLLIVTACVAVPDSQYQDAQRSTLTQGNVQMTLEKGVTSADDVLQAFGPPNISTLDAQGREIWTYQRQSVEAVQSSSANALTLLLVSSSSSAASGSRAQRTMTLIITLQNGVVVDFKSMSTSF